MRNFKRMRFAGLCFEQSSRFRCRRPFMLNDIDGEQLAKCIKMFTRHRREFAVSRFCAVKEARRQEVLSELLER